MFSCVQMTVEGLHGFSKRVPYSHADRQAFVGLCSSCGCSDKNEGEAAPIVRAAWQTTVKREASDRPNYNGENKWCEPDEVR